MQYKKFLQTHIPHIIIYLYISQKFINKTLIGFINKNLYLNSYLFSNI